MKDSSRTTLALFAAFATIVVALPLESLFTGATWVAYAFFGVLLVTTTGILLRGLSGRTGVTVLGQGLVATGYLLATQLGGTTVYGVIPTATTGPRFVELMRDAQETITTYAAPAPETPGVTVALVLIVVVVGLAVDMAGVTAASPAMAGLPLLSLFVVSAANSDGSLPWWWFVIGAMLWLAMMAHESDLEMREWTTSVPMLSSGHTTEDGQGVAERSLRWQGVRMGAVCLGAAVLLPSVLPHLPTRYLLDGLGAAGAGSARSTEGIRLSTELDLKRSLESPSTQPVLRYHTDDPTPEPLRVAVVTDFIDGFERMRPTGGTESTVPTPLRYAVEDIERVTRSLSVDANGVAPPQLAVPDNLTLLDVGRDIPWTVNERGTAWVQRAPTTYSTTYVEIEPEEEDFGAVVGSSRDPAVYNDINLALDPVSAEAIGTLAAELAPVGVDDLTAAQAFQEYLRGPEFTYSLDLPQDPSLPEDGILSFLETKVGYCQQYAATMTLLARAHGIPARVVVGFLPGESVGGDERTIRASDAHAWPELFFEGVGWTRFEPTPGARAATVPGYSISTDDATGADEQSTSTAPTTTTTTASTAPGANESALNDQAEGSETNWSRWLLTALVVIAALALMPVTALLTRRRDRTHAHDDAERVEREWTDLLERLEDLGIQMPQGATPRHVGEYVRRRAHLEDPTQEQLDHVVATLERARYGRPGQDLPDISDEVSAIVGDVRGQRMASSRLKAILWPSAGVDVWTSIPRRLGDLLRRP